MKPYDWSIVLMGAVAVAAILLCGCASFTEMADYCKPGLTLLPCKPTAAQSWDQANLKRNDHGCPTAIYANNAEGVLEQC